MKAFDKCPVCGSTLQISVKEDLKPHPYVGCGECSLYYQPTPVDKVFEAPHENRGDLMSESDKQVNLSLAEHLFNFWRNNSYPSTLHKYHLDIGTKYPYLGFCLQNVSEGSFTSFGIDGIPLVKHFGNKLGVQVLQTDFETPIESWDLSKLENPIPFLEKSFSIITLVHCIEHFYTPLESLEKIHDLSVNQSLVFIRCPDSDTPGVERDFTDGHYLIHPLIWNLQSMKKALEYCKDMGKEFELLQTYNFSGQRDYFLKVKKN